MSRVADHLVEKVHLGEASEAERALVLGDPDARARLEALPALNRAFLEAWPPEQAIVAIEGRARVLAARDDQRRSPNRANLLAMALAPALAAGLALLWVGIGQDTGEPGFTNIKGTPGLHLYRQRANGIERLNSGVVARKGDLLQLGVVSDRPEHGVVLSIDGRGQVTVHWPVDPADGTDLAPGEQRMPNAYQLDDAPNYERFFLVTTHGKPTDVSTVVHAAEALAASGTARDGTLAIPSGYDQSSFTIVKEEQPRGGAQ